MALDDLIKITYNSQVISNRVDKIRERISYRDYEIEVDFLVLESTESDFVSTRQTFETALEADSKALLIEYGPAGNLTTMRTYDPAARTGMMIRTSLSKAGAEIDSHRAIRYTWRAQVTLPADSTDDNGRREAQYSIEYSESRRVRLTFSGTYTAIAAGGAKATYDAQVGTWITSVFTALSLTQGDFEVISENIQPQDDEDAVLNFTQVWQEVLFPDDATGTYSDPNSLANVRNISVTFSRRADNTFGRNQKAPYRVDVNFSCALNSESLTPESLVSTWTATIKPHLITQAVAEFGSNAQAVESEVVTPDMTNNTLTAQMTLLMSTGSSGDFSFEQTIEITNEPSLQRTKLLDGNDHTYMFWTHGAEITAVLTVNKTKLGGAPANAFGWKDTKGGELSDKASALDLIAPGAGQGTWLAQGSTIRDTPRVIGVDLDGEGTSVELHQTTYTKQYLWVVKPNLRGTAESANNIQQVENKSGKKKSTGSNKKPSITADVEIYVPGEALSDSFGFR